MWNRTNGYHPDEEMLFARQEASIAKTAMHWTPEGKRKRGRPKITWRRTVEKEIKEMGKTWEGIKFMARCGGNTLLPYMPVRRKGHEREREFLQRKK